MGPVALAYFHMLRCKLKLLLCVHPPAGVRAHIHAAFGLTVNSAGNIICWGTAAGSLHRQNGRAGSLSQTQTTPNMQTHRLSGHRTAWAPLCDVSHPISGSQNKSMLGDRWPTLYGSRKERDLDGGFNQGSRGSGSNVTSVQFSRLSASLSYSRSCLYPGGFGFSTTRRCPGLSSLSPSAVFITKRCWFGVARWSSERHWVGLEVTTLLL